eukprot:CAMPEP_0174302132 /NCGR_PEP_ID=MMETSP0809-20121228/59459_1 /TAXON_ID=73025 ORGANISM="Eutreptiella gymnastica-like, Strain CCMP1594" /NCGR_SAMPLE_ID=MMETSP0809 /ASSEMBLY_ACC=CAM_ASM_000658 /LENGTH=129 /DNA_ID=CAMNT_0015408005 /DNA_START=53 /DNA_END=442 /DNA_ORIENTATION=+
MTLAQAAVVLILIAPMPNAVRGLVVKVYSTLIHSTHGFGSGVHITAIGLQALAFLDALSKVNHLEKHEYTGQLGDMINYNRLLLNQRNAYILGFGLLFAVLGWRILELDRQIYEVKKHNEEIDEQKKAQ